MEREARLRGAHAGGEQLIVFEAARGKASLSFMGYLRVGLPITLMSFVIGLALLLAEHALF